MKLTIEVSNEQDKIEVTDALGDLVFRAAEAALLSEGVDFDCELSLTYTDNAGIRALNSEYRGKDAATDVLSFPIMSDEDSAEDIDRSSGAVMLGDIVLSLERAREQAAEFGHSYTREVAFLTVHSVLHLLGYDHLTSEADDADMRARQNAVLEIMGIGR